MQVCPPDSKRGSDGELRLCTSAIANKSNAAEWLRSPCRNRNAEIAQSLDSVGHKTFAAGLVDWRNPAIGNHRTKAMAAG